MNKCYPDSPVPGTLSPPLSQATPPLLSSTGIAERVGVSGIFGPAHLTAGHRCPFAPRWIVVAILSLHADLCTFEACEFGRGLVYNHRVIFLQRRGKCVRALDNLRQAGMFLQNITSLKKHRVVLRTLSPPAGRSCKYMYKCVCVRTRAHTRALPGLYRLFIQLLHNFWELESRSSSFSRKHFTDLPISRGLHFSV